MPAPVLADACPGPPRALRGKSKLAKRAKELWEQFAPKLYESRILTELDVATLEDWCLTKAQLEISYAQMAVEGVEVETDRGSTKRSPSAQMVTQLSMQLRQLAAELGMTPRSRGALNLKKSNPNPPGPKTEGESEFEKHAAKRRKAIAR